MSVTEATTVLDEEGINDFETVFNTIFNDPGKIHAGLKGQQYVANQVYEAVTKEYTNEELTKEAVQAFIDYCKYLIDEFGDEAVEYIEKIVALVVENYDDLYEFGYAEADKAGYIALAASKVFTSFCE